MKLIVQLDDGAERVTSLAELADGASVLEVEPGLYSILRNGRSHVARVAAHPQQGLKVELDGRTSSVSLRDPRAMSRKGAGGAGAGRKSIMAPMPGKVVRVLVAAGDAVEEGQGLVVVEAMKMQNEMKAPKAGAIIEVRTEAGATVAAGEVLVILE